MLLATCLCEQGRLSLGQAAELVVYSKRTFMKLLADYGVAVFELTAARRQRVGVSVS